MATTGVINGTKFVVKSGSNVIAGAKNCKLTTGMEARDCTTKGSSGWQVLGEGMRKWSISVDGLLLMADSADEFPRIFNGYIQTRATLTISFTTETSGDAYWSGTAYCSSLEVDASVEDSTTYTATFEGTSTLTLATN